MEASAGVLRVCAFGLLTLALSVSAHDNVMARLANAFTGASERSILTGHVYRQILDKSRLYCGSSCLKNVSGCHSFNYCAVTKLCQLNMAKASKFPQDVATEEGCSYYDIQPECMTATGINYQYRYLPQIVDVRRIEFSVKARTNVYVGLSTVAYINKEIYEILIGGWNNTRSVIRRNAYGPNRNILNEAGLLDPNQFRGFWITYDQSTGRLTVGKKGVQEPFIHWDDPQPRDVKFVGFSTSWGSTGVFRYLCSI